MSFSDRFQTIHPSYTKTERGHKTHHAKHERRVNAVLSAPSHKKPFIHVRTGDFSSGIHETDALMPRFGTRTAFTSHSAETVNRQ